MLDDRQKSLQAKKAKYLRKRGKILDRTNGRCAYCGIPLDLMAMSIDHVIPRHRGGQSIYENLLAACKDCNTSKNELSVEEYRVRVQKSIQKRRYTQYKNLMSFQDKKSNRLKFYFEHLNIYILRDTFDPSWQEIEPLCDLSFFIEKDAPEILAKENKSSIITWFKNTVILLWRYIYR